jgi:hypothetical protein
MTRNATCPTRPGSCWWPSGRGCRQRHGRGGDGGHPLAGRPKSALTPDRTKHRTPACLYANSQRALSGVPGMAGRATDVRGLKRRSEARRGASRPLRRMAIHGRARLGEFGEYPRSGSPTLRYSDGHQAIRGPTAHARQPRHEFVGVDGKRRFPTISNVLASQRTDCAQLMPSMQLTSANL